MKLGKKLLFFLMLAIPGGSIHANWLKSALNQWITTRIPEKTAIGIGFVLAALFFNTKAQKVKSPYSRSEAECSTETSSPYQISRKHIGFKSENGYQHNCKSIFLTALSALSYLGGIASLIPGTVYLIDSLVGPKK